MFTRRARRVFTRARIYFGHYEDDLRKDNELDPTEVIRAWRQYPFLGKNYSLFAAVAAFMEDREVVKKDGTPYTSKALRTSGQKTPLEEDDGPDSEPEPDRAHNGARNKKRYPLPADGPNNHRPYKVIDAQLRAASHHPSQNMLHDHRPSGSGPGGIAGPAQPYHPDVRTGPLASAVVTIALNPHQQTSSRDQLNPLVGQGLGTGAPSVGPWRPWES